MTLIQNLKTAIAQYALAEVALVGCDDNSMSQYIKKAEDAWDECERLIKKLDSVSFEDGFDAGRGL